MFFVTNIGSEQFQCHSPIPFLPFAGMEVVLRIGPKGTETLFSVIRVRWHEFPEGFIGSGRTYIYLLLLETNKSKRRGKEDAIRSDSRWLKCGKGGKEGDRFLDPFSAL